MNVSQDIPLQEHLPEMMPAEEPAVEAHESEEIIHNAAEEMPQSQENPQSVNNTLSVNFY